MDPSLWMLAQNPEKSYEDDKEILQMLLDSIVLLSQRRLLRTELRKRKVYPIVRNLDYVLEDETISATIYEIVNFMMRDEDPNEADEISQANS